MQAAREKENAGEERTAALAEHARIQSELAGRSSAEEYVRQRLMEQRTALRTLEEEIQRHLHTLRSLEGERTALESDLASLREREAQLANRRTALQQDLESADLRQQESAALAERRISDSRRAAADADRARHQVGEFRRQEALDRSTLRESEELVAQLAARRQALEDLERDRVGLAPGAAALLAARDQFQGSILGPLSDFIETGRDDAELAERMLGEWVHAVLIRDRDVIPSIQRWHAESQTGAVVLLPIDPGPANVADGNPLRDRLRAQEPAQGWVRALLGGSEILDSGGRALRRANGAILLAGAAAPSGPLRRRAELHDLGEELARARDRLAESEATLRETMGRLAQAEIELEQATATADQAREAERLGVAAREDAARVAANLRRDHEEAQAQHVSLTERIGRSERRLAEIDAAITEGELGRAQLEESLGNARSHLAEFELEQESARESRVHWQVQEAHVAGRVQSATERYERAVQIGLDAEQQAETLATELSRLESDTGFLMAQQAQWHEMRAERRIALLELEAAAADVELELATAEDALATAEADLASYRHRLESMGEEHHHLELQVTEEGARKRSIIERVEAEWKKPIDLLLQEAPELDLDRESLEAEASRIVSNLEQIGPINPLAVEEHAEESKRLDFLTTQRDDLVAGRHSLQQAIREIDGTARTMFLETFTAVQANFNKVFQTLFGGGECDLRLASPDEPLESEIDIHAAPRGKRTQRIHLLSSGERTLVAASLLFSIYLTKPSPFCLMDEVDAPLDDANVGRFTRLLDEFKHTTQFIVITHNPRTMQAADAVYGVTMQEPGCSTIVGVRLGEKEPV
jgi:chromosome segregation protein